MKAIKLFLGVLLLSLVVVSSASADPVFTMYEEAYNQDGAVTDVFANDVFTSKSWSFLGISGTGGHSFILFVDPEIDEAINTYFNESGATGGILAAGQSWEIDEPGYVFGDIFTNFSAGALDNSNAVPSTTPDDVSMALGWDFTLASGYTADLNFYLNTTLPTSGFYLAQTDPDSNATLYFYSTLDIINNNPPTGVPEPGTLMLLAAGLAGLAGMGRKMKS